MLTRKELKYVTSNLRKAWKEYEALPRVLGHVELLLSHIEEVEAQRDELIAHIGKHQPQPRKDNGV